MKRLATLILYFLQVFIEYLDVEKNMLTPEQLIYLQLCSKESSIQQRAIDYIKKNYQVMKYIAMLIFFNYEQIIVNTFLYRP